jgi:hypothetical protein
MSVVYERRYASENENARRAASCAIVVVVVADAVTPGGTRPKCNVRGDGTNIGVGVNDGGVNCGDGNTLLPAPFALRG